MNTNSDLSLLVAIAQEVVVGKRTDLSVSDAQAILDGGIRVCDAEYYSRVLVAGGSPQSTNPLVKIETSKSPGTTNFDKAKLPAGRNLLVTEMALASGVNATLISTIFKQAFDAEVGLANGEIEIRQNGKTLGYFNVSTFQNGYNQTTAADAITLQNAEPKYFVKLKAPFVLRADWPVEAILSPSASLTSNTNVEITFKGLQTLDRS